MNTCGCFIQGTDHTYSMVSLHLMNIIIKLADLSYFYLHTQEYFGIFF